MSRLIHSDETRRQLAEAQAKHAATCERIVSQCVVCRDHFGMERKS